MWPYYPELLARSVPRYTSYPTAAEFSDDIGADAYEQALAAVETDEAISLYLHVPYCKDICWYCGCNTGAANRSERLAAYAARLGDEIELIARRLDGRGEVGFVAWGGGSPNALAPAQFTQLMTRARDAFGFSAADLSIELDPRSFTAEWRDCLEREGVSRASLGVQTFAPHVQSAIGRIQPFEMIARATEWLRQAGTRSINFDLMYGLPLQTDKDLVDTIDLAAALRPDRIAAFGYAHMPQLLARQRRIDATTLANGDARFWQAANAHAQLLLAGYTAIGFDHFALPDDPLARAARKGDLHRNFQGFTDDAAHILIGLGASAISSFPGLVVQNEKNAGRYQMRIGSGGVAARRGIRRSLLDRQCGAIIESLLCNGEADCSALPDLPLRRSALASFEALGLLSWQGDRLCLSIDALPYRRVIAASFDRFRNQTSGQFSHAV